VLAQALAELDTTIDKEILGVVVPGVRKKVTAGEKSNRPEGVCEQKYVN